MTFAHCILFELMHILLCRKVASFHAVLFSLDESLMYLCCMTQITQDAQDNAPRDPISIPLFLSTMASQV